ncbi:DUF6250 domain-containing protein [Solimonas marina]|uniref:Tat pathway signal sequence domain protein n=1 Tax=Solimonas marina TaxID=2714601 RepID=A0A970B7V8_9GAMM|nr:DUF6250 domain-containing protein [Solimonas marina]NKF24095.1 Tat pathway signal sequence domain protein [Solimonas marina]
MKLRPLLTLTLAAIPLVASAGEREIHRDDFRDGLKQWVVEAEKPGTITARDGVLDIDVPRGLSLWFRPELHGPIKIRYEATMVAAGGANDRVSDLNCFWMATDPRSPGDFFATLRSGKFADYDALKTYYVGLGGNYNKTTRFRRYIGKPGDRPMLPNNDLSSDDVLLKPNVTQTITLIADGRHIAYYRDGKPLFKYDDAQPYTHGHFALRTVWSHIRVRNFRVYALTPDAD